MIDVADKNTELAALQAEFWLYAVRHPNVMETFAARVRQRREPLEQLIGSEFSKDGGGYDDDLACRVAIVVSALFRAWSGSGASTRTTYRPNSTATPCAGCSPGSRRPSGPGARTSD